VGWKWSTDATSAKGNTISYNKIQNVMQELLDGGGIYTVGNQPSSTITNNWIEMSELKVTPPVLRTSTLAECSDTELILKARD